jgi:hypothetical protein
MKSRTAKGCLFVVLLLIIAGGYVFWRIKTPPKIAENFKELSPAEQQRRRDAAQQKLSEVEDVIHNIKRGDKSPFKLTASEETLNTLVQDRINTDKFAIHDLRIGLGDNDLTLQGTVPFKGMETTATLSGTVRAENGKLAYRVDRFLLGGLFDAPAKWKKKVERGVNEHLNKLLGGQKINITRAAVENKELVIEGQPQ